MRRNMNYIFRSLMILTLLMTAARSEQASEPEKTLFEKITEALFSEKEPEKTTEKVAEKASEAPPSKKTVEKVTEKAAEKESKKVEAKPLPEISMGKKDAPVVLINYSSLSCGHCAHFNTDILPKIEKKYIKPGYLRIVFRDYPGDQISLRAHQLAWCKGEMKYLDFLSLLYENQEKWLLADDPIAALKTIALQNGISTEQFEACMKNQELLDQIVAMRLDGQKKYNITATPTIVINTKIYQKALSLQELDDIMTPLLASYEKK